jgi:hypothetical protein
VMTCASAAWTFSVCITQNCSCSSLATKNRVNAAFRPKTKIGIARTTIPFARKLRFHQSFERCLANFDNKGITLIRLSTKSQNPLSRDGILTRRAAKVRLLARIGHSPVGMLMKRIGARWRRQGELIRFSGAMVPRPDERQRREKAQSHRRRE